ncbi:unnamed protein product [Cuscuta epithymum]|uniref:Uncharacterized protein n=1 Tax=Cuscuta epithymum TaxID=186058 RepID=A0AAV0F9Y7_9ASTE|nr:unnamed protein product [Cuscuta epithymum]
MGDPSSSVVQLYVAQLNPSPPQNPKPSEAKSREVAVHQLYSQHRLTNCRFLLRPKHDSPKVSVFAPCERPLQQHTMRIKTHDVSSQRKNCCKPMFYARETIVSEEPHQNCHPLSGCTRNSQIPYDARKPPKKRKKALIQPTKNSRVAQQLTESACHR